MASFNRFIFAGNLTKDPEARQTTSGESVTKFTVAVNRLGKKANGECDFFNVVAFGSTADSTARYLKKGSSVMVCGRIQQRRWTDKQGNNRTDYEVTAEEVTFLSSIVAEEAPAVSAPPNPTMWGHGTPQEQFEPLTDDENLPF